MVTGDIAAAIWRIAEILRGDYKQSEYGRIILPFTLLRRLDCMLEPTKENVLAANIEFAGKPDSMIDTMLKKAANYPFYNTSPWTFKKIAGDSQNVYANLTNYLGFFPESIRDIFDRYRFNESVEGLQNNGLLYPVVKNFAALDLSPADMNSMDMSIYYEELIRRFSEISNETAGEHFTPREVIHLMVDLVITRDEPILTKPGVINSIYDPTAGTGGMLSIADEKIKSHNPDGRLVLFGQELNPESYAICKSELLIKDQPITNIVLGNTLSNDGHEYRKFDFMLSNPPFGVEWKKIKDEVEKEHRSGYTGRFGPGLPRISDGSLLFLLHLLSKMNPIDDHGSRIGIVFNGSPLFTGGAGSGESEIRRWIIQEDYLEAIVALPTDMFYNTGIATYIWVLSNRKPPERQGKVQLINATTRFHKLRKSLGAKRNELGTDDIAYIASLHDNFVETPDSKIFKGTDFGYRTITVERPLQLNFQTAPARISILREQLGAQKKAVDSDAIVAAVKTLDPTRLYLNREEFFGELKRALNVVESPIPEATFKVIWQALSERDEAADICRDRRGNPEPDTSLRDTENVPLDQDIDEYFAREVLPYVPNAWIDREKRDETDHQVGIVGYEIPFTRHFYTYTPPRSLTDIDTDVQRLTHEIMDLLGEVLA